MISVCMATYNGEKYVKEQIDSIIKQLSKGDEIIVSDDGSTDGTLRILDEFHDDRIKVYRNRKERRYTANFENALCECQGDYIFLCDQDDVWVDDKVKTVIQALQDYDFVMTDAYVANKGLDVILESRNRYYKVRNGFWRNFIKTRYLGCCMAFKRNVLEYSLPFPANRDLCLHDYWISMVAELYFKTYVIDKQLIYYRRHDSNASSGGESHSNPAKIVKIRLYVLWNLFRRKCRKNDKIWR